MTLRQMYDKMINAWADEDIPQAKALALQVREHVVQGQWPKGVDHRVLVTDLYALTGRAL